MLDLRRHIFLTGEKQVGKSTLLRRLIDEKRLDCAGFETQPFFLNGERRGFLLHGRVALPPFENDCVIAARIGARRSVAVRETFDENGVRILRLSQEAAGDFLLMDELGKLERSASAFCAQVLQTLEGGKRVLGVLQACEAPLLSDIRARADVSVLTVTADNRDELLQALLREV